jgi:aspartyl-tRNA(Asn)/glutamyl-tRNA(Gln) amidotransferase subunit A
MKKLNELTLQQAREKVQKKEVTAKEIHTAVHLAIEEKNAHYNAYLAVDEKSETDVETLISTPLAGLPIAVKDNFLTVGLTTTASSFVLKDFAPPYDSTVTKRLKQAGGVVVGKTNMDAWAHGSSTETSDFGTSKNPRNIEHSPGGSSGGSATAVGADLCIAAVGSETAGSIRIPAAWCGIVGLKPTYGRVSRAGVIAMGSSLDSPGPMTKTVEDAAILLNEIAGKDPYDATTSPHAVPDYTAQLHKGVRGLKIGVVYMDHPDMPEEVRMSIRQASTVFSAHGAVVEEVKLSEDGRKGTILTPDHAIGVYTVVQRGEVSSNLARYDGIRYGNPRSFFGAEAKRRIMLGTFTLSTGYADKYYVKAQQVRNIYVKNFAQLFNMYDILLSTPSPGYAPKIGSSDGNPMFGEIVDMLNEPSSLAGLPAISVPCYKHPDTGLYLGLSLMGNHFAEEIILQAAYLYEQETKWNSWIQHV